MCSGRAHISRERGKHQKCTRGLLSHGAEMLPELPKTGAGGGAGAFRGVGPASQDGFDTATSNPAPVLSLCPLLARLRLRAPSRLPWALRVAPKSPLRAFSAPLAPGGLEQWSPTLRPCSKGGSFI